MEKIRAWTRPTNISRAMKGNEAKKAHRQATTMSKTSPAKMLPKSRKEKDMILMNSLINSRMPTKEFDPFSMTTATLPIIAAKPVAAGFSFSAGALLKKLLTSLWVNWGVRPTGAAST